MAMSARLLKGGTHISSAFAPFTIPTQAGTNFVAETEFPPALRPAHSSAEEAERRIHWLLETAQSEAESVIAQARTAAAQIEREAYEKGCAEAHAQMAEEVNRAVQDLRARLTQTLLQLEPLYAVIATRAEHDLVRLALEVARKVVHREVTTDADIVLTLARVALERLHPRAVAKVLLHPEDLEFVVAHRQQLNNNSTLEFVADPSVGRGGCIVQSEHGDIDARIEQQFTTIERGFFE